jgi:DNA-binding transcriptional regulator YhcF (GntR family)
VRRLRAFPWASLSGARDVLPPRLKCGIPQWKETGGRDEEQPCRVPPDCRGAPIAYLVWSPAAWRPAPRRVRPCRGVLGCAGTVRRAVEHLAQERLVSAVHGRGWFVTDAKGKPLVAPKHQEVADALRQRISAGKLSTGSVLPSEAALSNEFDISRDTARKAFGS